MKADEASGSKCEHHMFSSTRKSNVIYWAAKAKKELSQETKSNFSRVTPAQLPHIEFSVTGKYQPVRAVSSANAPSSRVGRPSKTLSAAEKYAGGGGIIILRDIAPDQEVEYIELNPPPPAPAPVQAPAATATAAAPTTSRPSGPHIALDDDAPEASPPGSFDVSNMTFFLHPWTNQSQSLVRV